MEDSLLRFLAVSNAPCLLEDFFEKNETCDRLKVEEMVNRLVKAEKVKEYRMGNENILYASMDFHEHTFIHVKEENEPVPPVDLKQPLGLRKRLSKRSSRSPKQQKQSAGSRKLLFTTIPANGKMELWTIAQLQKYNEKRESRLLDLEHKKRIVEKNKQKDEETLVLIDKWVEVCKEGIMELQGIMKESSRQVSLPEIMANFRIEPSLLKYDEDTEDFL